MFGEDESESPRVGSPWDSLMSSSPATPSSLSGSSEHDLRKIYSIALPKLVPEADAGNVEYKLQLIEPTPERFLRLVTQLKWRLLEGGGQAYYELGVADSGQLVGLTRVNLERSLETLEMMAGEIGASVVVVKEIEVPLSMFESASREGKVCRNVAFKEKPPRKGSFAPAEALRRYRTRPSEGGALEVLKRDMSSLSINTSESDASWSGSESRDTEDSDMHRLSPRGRMLELTPPDNVPHTNLPDGRPINIVPHTLQDQEEGMFPFDIEIATVFKPLEPRAYEAPSLWDKRFTLPNTPPNKAKKEQKQKQKPRNDGDKAALKRATRDEARARRVASGLTDPQTTVQATPSENDTPNLSASPADTVTASQDAITVPENVKGLAELHVAVAVPKEGEEESRIAMTATSIPEFEPRVIVEALVVKKMSTEEAFLDFGGFSLAD